MRFVDQFIWFTYNRYFGFYIIWILLLISYLELVNNINYVCFFIRILSTLLLVRCWYLIQNGLNHDYQIWKFKYKCNLNNFCCSLALSHFTKLIYNICRIINVYPCTINQVVWNEIVNIEYGYFHKIQLRWLIIGLSKFE